jgi:hypothetical protein
MAKRKHELPLTMKRSVARSSIEDSLTNISPSTPESAIKTEKPDFNSSASKGWDIEDDIRLLDENKQSSVKKLAQSFGRSEGSIRSRLKHLEDPEHAAYKRMQRIKGENFEVDSAAVVEGDEAQVSAKAKARMRVEEDQEEEEKEEEVISLSVRQKEVIDLIANKKSVITK